MRAFLRYLTLCSSLALPAWAQTGDPIGGSGGSEDYVTNAFRGSANNRLQYAGRYGATTAMLRYYGSSGTESLFGSSPLDYRFESVGTLQRLQFTHGNTPLYAGLHYMLATTRSRFVSEDLPDGVHDRDLKSNLGGVGASVEYDTRDNPFDTRSGTDLHANATWYDQALGSSSTFGKLELAALTYMRPSKRWSLGARVDARSAWGAVPFFDAPYLAMRGLQARQFTNDVVMLAEVESRHAITPRWTLLAFGGAGRTATTWREISANAALMTHGVGFRYLLSMDSGLRAGVDVAQSPDGSLQLYLQTGSVWR